MRKITALVIALSFMLTLAACNNGQPENANPGVAGKFSVDDIGMTINEIMEKYPELAHEGPETSGLMQHSLSAPGSDFHYFIYSVGAGAPCLGELINSGDYGDVLVVSGVMAPVGDVFTQTTDPMPADDFFGAIGAVKIEKDFYDDVNGSYIRFEFGDMIGLIHLHGHYRYFENVSHDVVVHIVNPVLESNNHQNLPWWGGS